MRAFGQHAETLTKMRRPAHQTIRVEKVEIRDGSQALIGITNGTPRGGL
jgi:hypothetical protein